jgi:hypothetical protein
MTNPQDKSPLEILNGLAIAEYGLPLATLIARRLWFARLGRLVGVVVKAPFGTAQASRAPSTATGALRQWFLRDDALSDPLLRTTWQYGLLDRVARETGFSNAEQLASYAQQERAFFRSISATIEKSICVDEVTRTEIREVVEELRNEDGTTPPLTRGSRLTPPAQKLEKLLAKRLPWLHPTLVTAYTLIIGLAGIDGFCVSVNARVEADVPVPDPGAPALEMEDPSMASTKPGSPDVDGLMRLIREGIRAVPAVKYALGLAAIAATIQIGVLVSGGNIKLLALGIPLTLGMMVILLLFARAAAVAAAVVLWPIRIIVWASTIAFVILLGSALSALTIGHPERMRDFMFPPASATAPLVGFGCFLRVAADTVQEMRTKNGGFRVDVDGKRVGTLEDFKSDGREDAFLRLALGDLTPGPHEMVITVTAPGRGAIACQGHFEVAGPTTFDAEMVPIVGGSTQCKITAAS